MTTPPVRALHKGAGKVSLGLGQHTAQARTKLRVVGCSPVSSPVSARFSLTSLRSSLTLTLTTCLGILSLVSTAQAVNYTWDPDAADGGIVTEGTGNWDTTTSNWTTDGGTTNVVAPSSAFGSDLFFGGGAAGTAGTITLTETGNRFGSLSFNSPNASSYDLDLNGNIVEVRRSSGTFKVRADATISDSSGGGELRHDTSQYRDYSTGSTLSISADVADRSSALVRTYDTITLDLSGVNTYTGNTEINNSSTLRISGAGQLGSGTYAGTIAINNNGILDYNSSATQTLNGVISGSGSLVLNGTGQLNLSVNNNFSGGVTVNNGTLGLEISAIDGGPLTVNGGLVSGSIHDSFDNISVSELSGSGGLIEAARRTFTVTQATNTTYAGVIQDLNGIVSDGNGTVFTKAGSGTLTLTGDNTYSKTTNVNGGTLEVSGGLYSAGTNVGGSSNINIGAAGTLDVTGSGSIGSGSAFDGTIANSGTFNYNSTTDQELSGIISGAGAIEKDNTGTLTLTGANTYSGDTTVSNGTLAIDGTHTGGAQYTVNAGGTLAGSGSFDAIVEVNGVISPGNSPGTMATGTQTWNNGGSYLWEINATADAGGSQGSDPGWDWMDITGTLELGSLSAGGYTIDIDSWAGGGLGEALGFDTFAIDGYESPFDVDYSFIIASTSAGINGFDANLFTLDSSGFSNSNPLAGWHWEIIESGNDLVLQAYAVPEPSSTALLGLGGLALMLRRKRS